MISLFDRVRDLRFKRNLVRAKKMYNKTRSGAKALAVFRYNPDPYIVRTNLAGRMLTGRSNLVNHLNALGLQSIVNAAVIPKYKRKVNRMNWSY